MKFFFAVLCLTVATMLGATTQLMAQSAVYADRDRMVVVNGNGGNVRSHQPFSPADEARLDDLLRRRALKEFGPPPTSGHEWRGTQQRFLPVANRCQEERRRVTGGTMVRVVCNGRK